MFNSRKTTADGFRGRRLVLTIAALTAGLLAAQLGRADVTERQLRELGEFHDRVESFIDEHADDIERIGERSREMNRLKRRIEAARDDPRALDGDNYAELVVDLILVLPESVRLPPAITRGVKLLAGPVGWLIGAATDNALNDVRTNFTRYYRSELTTGAPSWVAAKRAAELVGGTRQVRLKMLYEWKAERLGQS